MSAKKEITYKVDKNGCWICDSHSPIRGGYPYLSRNNRDYSVHRWVYMQKHHIDYLPFETKIRHTCDNTMCINPSHLLSGTHTDNMRDKVNRGRGYRGVKHHSNKLTEKQVLEIRHNSMDTQRELGRLYNVSQVTIGRIKHKKIWAWLK